MQDKLNINLFYEEPESDRWFKYDRHLRKIIRRIWRGPDAIGGMKRWFVNLCLGLDELGIKYTVNNYKLLKRDPSQWALVIGKPHVLEKIPDHTNLIYGPAISSHPSETNVWKRKNIRNIIASCEWLKELYERDLNIDIPVAVWPSGIETQKWLPKPKAPKTKKILIYDKIRWDYDKYHNELISPILSHLQERNISYEYIRYGFYKEEDFRTLLTQVDAMIFLCEHETQGFAYLQTLSSNVPIFAWDRGGYWQDPSFYPDRVKFKEVTSVPYWEERCGLKFKNSEEFSQQIDLFWREVQNNEYHPRDYILENLTLEKCAQKYIAICKSTMDKHHE